MVVTNYQHSGDSKRGHMPCVDVAIEDLIKIALDTLGCTSSDVINVQMDGPFGANEWGVRVFCRKPK